VQQRRGKQRLGGTARPRGEQLADGQRMVEVGSAVVAQLTPVGLGREIAGASERLRFADEGRLVDRPG
jgi:hypothetical protein